LQSSEDIRAANNFVSSIPTCSKTFFFTVLSECFAVGACILLAYFYSHTKSRSVLLQNVIAFGVKMR
jgi:hypothetical protein